MKRAPCHGYSFAFARSTGTMDVVSTPARTPPSPPPPPPPPLAGNCKKISVKPHPARPANFGKSVTKRKTITPNAALSTTDRKKKKNQQSQVIHQPQPKQTFVHITPGHTKPRWKFKWIVIRPQIIRQAASWKQDYDDCLKEGKSMVLQQEEELRILWEWSV